MALQALNVTKAFHDPEVTVLHSINLNIEDGEFVSIVGRSGSGKTTLLYLLSTLDSPTSGNIVIAGKDPSRLSVEEIHDFRNRSIGYVFQFHYLLPELTVLENVLLPARRCHEHREREGIALRLLKSFGLEGKQDRLPKKLSGGEQQRVAIARALVMEPKYIFADEPTGNLDTANGRAVMNLLTEINRERGTTVVLVTHEMEFAALARRQVRLVDGRLVD